MILNLNLFLFTVFFIPAILKLKDPLSFEKLFKLLSFQNARIYSRIFIFAEMISSLLLLHSKTQKLGLILIVLLSCGFIFAVQRSKSLSVSVNCNCFGSLSNDNLDNNIIIRSLLFIGLASIVFIQPSVDVFSSKYIDIMYGIFNSVSIIAGYLILTNIKKYIIMINSISKN